MRLTCHVFDAIPKRLRAYVHLNSIPCGELLQAEHSCFEIGICQAPGNVCLIIQSQPNLQNRRRPSLAPAAISYDLNMNRRFCLLLREACAHSILTAAITQAYPGQVYKNIKNACTLPGRDTCTERPLLTFRYASSRLCQPFRRSHLNTLTNTNGAGAPAPTFAIVPNTCKAACRLWSQGSVPIHIILQSPHVRPPLS